MIDNTEATAKRKYDYTNVPYEMAGNFMKDEYENMPGTPSEKIRCIMKRMTKYMRENTGTMPVGEQNRQIIRFGVKSIKWWLDMRYKTDKAYITPLDLSIPEQWN